jgi:transposase-like protein
MHSLKDVCGLDYGEARRIIEDARWESGVPTCPHCGCMDSYDITTRNKYRCKSCLRQYSVLSGTMLCRTKLALRDILTSAFLFARARKGIASINLANLAGVQQRTAFYLCHVFRNGLVSEISKLKLSGVVEIDGATFGGHMRFENCGLTGRKRVKRYNQRCVVVVAKQRLGRTVPIIVAKEADAKERLSEIILPGSVVVADQARGWNSMLELYDMLRVNHTYTFGSNATACTNNAESFFSGMRKMHDGTHHWMSLKYMPGYASELAWKRDAKDRGMNDEELTMELLRSCLRQMPCYVPSAPSLLEVA